MEQEKNIMALHTVLWGRLEILLPKTISYFPIYSIPLHLVHIHSMLITISEHNNLNFYTGIATVGRIFVNNADQRFKHRNKMGSTQDADLYWFRYGVPNVRWRLDF